MDQVTLLLARRLREARRTTGLTLQEVARACGVAGKATVSRWESETAPRRPEDATLLRLADLYGVSLDFLYGRRHADPESPGLRAARAEVRRRLSADALRHMPLHERVIQVVAVVREAAPEALPELRLQKLLREGYRAIAEGRTDVVIPADGLTDLASLVGLPPRALLEG